MNECIFCRIIAGELPSDMVHQDNKVVVFRDIHPKAQTHLLIVPREHIVSLNELTPEHDALIAHIIRLLPQLAAQEGLTDGFRTIINTGKGGGQEVFHLHVHLIGGPRL